MNGFGGSLILAGITYLAGFLLQAGAGPLPFNPATGNWEERGTLLGVLIVTLGFIFKVYLPKQTQTFEGTVERLCTAVKSNTADHKATVQSIIDAHNVNKEKDREEISAMRQSLDLNNRLVALCPKVEGAAKTILDETQRRSIDGR